MSKTIKDRLKQDDKVYLTRCFKEKGKVYELGEYAVKDLPDSVYKLGLAIAKPMPKKTEESKSESKTSKSK